MSCNSAPAKSAGIPVHLERYWAQVLDSLKVRLERKKEPCSIKPERVEAKS